MTQAEKARAYDEALKRAKNVFNCEANDRKPGTSICEYIFPELAESKDEKIRKAIKRAISIALDYSYFDKETADDCLTWLEKQGEQKNKINLCKITFEDVLALECSMKTAKITKGGDELYKILVPLYNKIHNAYLDEKQCEQELVDMVEPKFKIGDRIADNITKDVFLIKSINNGYCTLEDINGNIFSPCLLLCESESHLWTIQDAKDGDVLTNGKMVVIFKQFDEPAYKQHIIAYIGLDANGNIQITDDTWNLGIDKAKLATKEQRDLLFKKMDEAGYEWDAEKKELKKISQRMISAETKETMYTNPAWNEEDEHRIKDTIYFLDTAKKHYASTVEIDACIDWLKSLRQRIEE